MAASTKDTIYVDVDDEITTIIDKVRESDAKIVALVLPKRASVFQSVVNMKLLKRTADAAKKHIVLVTTEPSLMPLAAAVGMHVAATPQSKPEIPIKVMSADDGAETIDEDDDGGYSAQNAGHIPIGALAGSALPAADDGVETLNLPDEDEELPEDEAAEGESGLPQKQRHLNVPNFNRFRARLFLGVLLLVLLVAGFYVANVVLPRASIAVATNTSTLNASFNMTLDSAAQTLDPTKMVIPAKADQQQKTTTQQVPTTGQENTGSVATGTVDMTAGACGPTFPADVPAGTGVSTNGLTYITQKDASFGASNQNGHCVWKASGVPITAQSPGAKYNVQAATFTVAGRSDVSATGSATGGTDNIIQIVTQADIDNATQKLTSQDTSAIKTGLEQALQTDGMYALPDTFNAGTPVVTNSNKVGDQATTVTVTQAVTYSMYGVKESDLTALIQDALGSQINPSTQSVSDFGLANAKASVTSSGTGSEQVSFATVATVGPVINATEVKNQAKGKKAGDVKAQIGSIPGVTSVNVQLSPFWVSTVPTNLNKVTVTITGAK